MKNLISIAVIALLAVLAGMYFTLGPNVFLGGPTNSAIVDVTRQVMAATATTEDAKQSAAGAEITPRGICSSKPNGVYACIVDVSVNGAPATSMVSLLRKADSGWVAADQ